MQHRFKSLIKKHKNILKTTTIRDILFTSTQKLDAEGEQEQIVSSRPIFAHLNKDGYSFLS